LKKKVKNLSGGGGGGGGLRGRGKKRGKRAARRVCGEEYEQKNSRSDGTGTKQANQM